MPTVEELKTSLDASIGERAAAEKEIRETLTTQAEEVKKYGQTTKETAEKLAAAETKLDDHGKRIEEVQKELLAQVETHAKRVDELEKKAQRPGWQGADGTTQQESIGTQFTRLLETGGDQARKLVLDGRGDLAPILALKGFDGAPAFSGLSPAEIRKAVGSADLPVPPTFEPGYLAIPRRRLRMRDLMTVVRTDAPVRTYLEEVGFMAVTKLAVTSITRVGQVATITTTAAHGLRTFDRVRVSGAAQTEYNIDARITVTSATTFTYTVAGSPTTPATGTILVQRLNNFGAANFVAEGALKPEATMSRKEVQVRMEVVAHALHLARQILDDLPGLRAEIDNAGIYGLLRREEDALLYGSGVSPQIQGILTHPNVQNYAWSSGPVGSGDKRVDAIRRAITRVEIADLEATGAVINSLAWEDIELTKGSDGHYIWVEAPGTGGESRVWRLPLVVTNAIDGTDFLVGAFNTGATLYDREQANVRFSDSHDDNFLRNLVTLLFEERIGAAWKRPEAFVHGVFDAAPAAS
jgi:HK97 family phage major capsid protein